MSEPYHVAVPPQPVEVKRGRGRPRKEVAVVEDKDFFERVKENQLSAASFGDDEIRKPTHDARIQYYKVLEFILLTTKFCSMNGNYQAWYRGLRQFYNMIVPYVKPDKIAGIKEKFHVVEKMLRTTDHFATSRDGALRHFAQNMISDVDEKLLEIEEALHMASKDMMLPTGGGIEGDLDDMLKASGL